MTSAATLLTNATLACMPADAGGLGLCEDAALLVEGGRIAWIGPTRRARQAAPARAEVVDCAGGLVTPGLVDCHTHLVHAGDRCAEFAQRLAGASYAEIAAAGGGIAATVAATRAASPATLYAQTLPRLQQLLAEGVTSLEIKSGYGLDLETECDMLAVARDLGATYGVRVLTTFLGAHALPPEYAGRPDAWIAQVCEEILPTAHAAGLVDAVDVFIESMGFSVAQARRVFDTARMLGLPVKAHVEQFSNLGGSRLAAEYGALSVDHLEYLEATDVPALAGAGTVAVLLPGAFHFLRETRRPPVAALREHGVPMAVATDANPGSSPLYSLLTAASLACTLFGLTVDEALRGITVNAARALGIAGETGSLSVGHEADIALWHVRRPEALVCQLGVNPLRAVMRGGIWRGRAATGEWHDAFEEASR